MRIANIGATGYVGQQVMHEGALAGHEMLGFYARNPESGMGQFDLSDPATWTNVLDVGAQAIIWTASGYDASKEVKEGDFKDFTDQIPDSTQIVYLSSDVTLSNRPGDPTTSLARYTAMKRREQQVILEHKDDSLVLVTGPVYGVNAVGQRDKRSVSIIEDIKSGKKRECWSDVYRTFVPVEGLASVIIGSLGRDGGKFFAGPPNRASYYNFYQRMALEMGFGPELIVKDSASDERLANLGVARDTSYARNPHRLWLD